MFKLSVQNIGIHCRQMQKVIKYSFTPLDIKKMLLKVACYVRQGIEKGDFDCEGGSR